MSAIMTQTDIIVCFTCELNLQALIVHNLNKDLNYITTYRVSSLNSVCTSESSYSYHRHSLYKDTGTNFNV